MIAQGDPVIKEFMKAHNAAEHHAIRQHILRIHRDIKKSGNGRRAGCIQVKTV